MAASWRAMSRSARSEARAARGADASAEQVKALYRDVPYEEVPLDGMRATIAARLTQAATIPHFYLDDGRRGRPPDGAA